MALLDLLPSRGPYAFEQLYNSCVAKELNGAADVLKPNLPTHFKSSQVGDPSGNLSEDDDLPDVWPSEEITRSDIQVRKITNADTKLIERYKYSLSPEGQKKYYLMKNKIKGRVLVINNDKFTHLPARDGTSKDRRSIETVFGDKGLGFEVYVKTNMTGEQMLKHLHEEAARDHSQFDCFILFILSHGHEGIVYGTDGFTKENKHNNFVSITDIRNIFCSVPALVGKPKIFFIQACQGTTKDKGMFTNPADRTVGDVSSSPSPTSNTGSSTTIVPMDVTMGPSPTINTGFSTKTGPIDVIDNKRAVSPPVQLKQTFHAEVLPVEQKAPDSSSSHLASKTWPLESDQDINIRQVRQTLHTIWDGALEQSDAYGEKTPSLADAFIAMATTPGNLSWRNTKYGTWFIQAITFVFGKYAYKNEIQKLMTQVNSLVSKAETIKGNYKQVAEKKDTFTKLLYLFPGLPVENT